MVSQIFGDKPTEQKNGSHIAATNLRIREYRKEYLDYWNSTAALTGTGRPVDAFIAPVTPYAAAPPDKFRYYGYTPFANVLDYTSCAIPVTTADKSVDVYPEGEKYEPVNDMDKLVHEECEYSKSMQ